MYWYCIFTKSHCIIVAPDPWDNSPAHATWLQITKSLNSNCLKKMNKLQLTTAHFSNFTLFTLLASFFLKLIKSKTGLVRLTNFQMLAWCRGHHELKSVLRITVSVPEQSELLFYIFRQKFDVVCLFVFFLCFLFYHLSRWTPGMACNMVICLCDSWMRKKLSNEIKISPQREH